MDKKGHLHPFLATYTKDNFPRVVAYHMSIRSQHNTGSNCYIESRNCSSCRQLVCFTTSQVHQKLITTQFQKSLSRNNTYILHNVIQKFLCKPEMTFLWMTRSFRIWFPLSSYFQIIRVKPICIQLIK